MSKKPRAEPPATPAQTAKKTGRGGARPGAGKPQIPINAETVANSAAIGCTVEEIATIVGVGRSTFRDRVTPSSDTFDPAILEAIERGRLVGRATLRRLQWKQAEGGDKTMLIWLGKQMLEQRDKVDQATSIRRVDPADLTDEELAAVIRGDA